MGGEVGIVGGEVGIVSGEVGIVGGEVSIVGGSCRYIVLLGIHVCVKDRGGGGKADQAAMC